jgi:hypothetical protein
MLCHRYSIAIWGTVVLANVQHLDDVGVIQLCR